MVGGEHLVLYVDRLVRHPPNNNNNDAAQPVAVVEDDAGGSPSLPAAAAAAAAAEASSSSSSSSSAPPGSWPTAVSSTAETPDDGDNHEVKFYDDEDDDDEEAALLGDGGGGQTTTTTSSECRICQEEDGVRNLETPCACRGSLKYAHRKCVQRWCNEKGDIICEICRQAYQPGYTAPPPPPLQPDETSIDIGGGWTVSGTPLDLHDPRLLAIAEAERQFYEAEYDDYAASSASGAAFCRSAALILMALLLLRHALTVPDTDGDEDASAFFSLFLLRAAGFLLPCYIMAWAISILQRRRQRQEAAAAMAATQVAFVLQSGQHRGLQFTIAPTPSLPHHPTDSV